MTDGPNGDEIRYLQKKYLMIYYNGMIFAYAQAWDTPTRSWYTAYK